ncbi:hypothetical protein [Emticicia sp. BO119]|uniref:hypothetical protein n=1 Tax=Emticicia sp. BO119 TaxID=2757768 RepID=UPI0015F065CA|nr:hypothetical protein [Emticicia sp. BO119]MBA4851336.1 hypothetical protein [Emticicia sp. BO119]
MNLDEVINPALKPSKQQAIKLPEEKKNLLDLRLITTKEYNKFKKEYGEIILKSGN